MHEHYISYIHVQNKYSRVEQITNDQSQQTIAHYELMEVVLHSVKTIHSFTSRRKGEFPQYSIHTSDIFSPGGFYPRSIETKVCYYTPVLSGLIKSTYFLLYDRVRLRNKYKKHNKHYILHISFPRTLLIP